MTSIPIRPDHFAALMIYAFRYCLGRGSYAPSEMADILRVYGKRLDGQDRKLIVREIRKHVERDTGDHFRSGWEAVARELDQ